MKNIIKALIVVSLIIGIAFIGLQVIEWVCTSKVRYGVTIVILIATAYKSLENLI